MVKVILISGKARSAKDTFAAALQKNLEANGKRVLNIHYADFLKFFCTRYLGWNQQKDDYGRSLLQRVGTQVVRKNYEHAWTDIMIAVLRGMRTEYDFCLIPDTRFPNEIEDLMVANTKIFPLEEKFAEEITTLRVERPFFDNGLTPEQKAHESETALDDWEFDSYFLNIGTLQDLEDHAKEWVDIILNHETKQSN